MRMMPMAMNITAEQPRVDVKQRLAEQPETKSFKSEYDNQRNRQIDTDNKTKQSEESNKEVQVSHKENEQIKDVSKDDNKTNTEANVKPNKSDKANTDTKETKVTDKTNSAETTKNGELDKNILQFVKKASAEVPKPESNKNKDIKNVSNKTKSEKEIKATDKDLLNQSMASSSLINVEKNPDIKLEVTEDVEAGVKELTLDGKKSEETEGLSKDNQEVSNNKNVNLNQVSDLKKSVEKKPADNKVEKKEGKLKVNDLRTQNTEVSNVKEEAANNQVTPVKLDSAETLEAGADKTIILGSTEISAEGEGGKAQAPVMKEAASILKQQLKDFGNNEIVKQSRFIFKDNNVGEIKLILKPESLGQVKINLNLNENSLAGQIVVENNSVKEIFQENMSQLTKALKAEGFDTADLELSYNGEKESDKKDKADNKQYFSDRLKRIDESGQVVRYGTASAGINLTA
ncbi:MAG: flagellar hook-length control protein FliK [Spirochaetaceae bacterium]